MTKGATSPPSGSELRLLHVLWRHGRLSAREVHDATVAQTGWAYSTTRKTLDRMVDKHIVVVEVVHGMKTFAPARAKLDTVARLIRDFATNVLDADGPLPAAAFARSRILDKSELKALEALLQRDEDDS